MACAEGFEYEADPLQGEKLIEAMRLDANCNMAATPGIKPLLEQLEKDFELSPGSHTDIRGLAARANYLSADGIDLQFLAKRSAVS